MTAQCISAYPQSPEPPLTSASGTVVVSTQSFHSLYIFLVRFSSYFHTSITPINFTVAKSKPGLGSADDVLDQYNGSIFSSHTPFINSAQENLFTRSLFTLMLLLSTPCFTYSAMGTQAGSVEPF